MTQDVDYIIDLLKNLTTNSKKGKKDELGEQDAAAGIGGGGGNTNKRGSNWNELYATVRGKANMLGKSGEKWETGVKRGSANQVW
ncbi:hypothetical protein UFOVP117_311 [uncultured Caudovirales phage]|uniref:Uncharacterized protein n=1 Tax=uncultured Caudovirales phage TaxID=2100421 RepID=A0A6J5L9X9_9CAUD|nr:hypothetical protein UFOVP117_311 [uncultured Caudovirales phage]